VAAIWVARPLVWSEEICKHASYVHSYVRVLTQCEVGLLPVGLEVGARLEGWDMREDRII
jgi:hypothetical protein